MQDTPLTLVHLFERAERLFAGRAVVTASPAGRESTSYGSWAERTRRLGSVLEALGISDDGRVATFGWNTARHLELYFAVPCTGRVLHTLNIRLFPEQLLYVINHAEDEVVFIDRSLAGLLWPLLERCPTVRHVIVIDDHGGLDPGPAPAGIEVHDYEELLGAASPATFKIDDEWRAASMCYTSGTTGDPKGVVYTHRSTVLHTFGVLVTDSLGIRESDVVLPVVPMFHANAWGLAHAAVACGASLVLPGSDLSPTAVAALIDDEHVTVAAGVPTIWNAVLPELAGRRLPALRSIICGGSAVPRTLSEAYRTQVGLPILQAWGMTETSPAASVCRITSTLAAELDDDRAADLRSTIGVPILGVDARVVVDGAEVPVDGSTSGELQVRGSWITGSYYDDDKPNGSFTDDGWLRTGDVAVVDGHRYLRIVDRTKDVIKSGGEWISSVALENELMAHPAVLEAAVIGVPHPRWDERPLACVVLRDGAGVTADELTAFLGERVVRWWLPDDIVFVDAIPKTSVGKFSKKDLRHRFADHVLPTTTAVAP